jgi:hypothetical protein
MVDQPYTDNQRKAAWLYMTQKAEQLNDSGKDMRVVLKPTYSIPWTDKSFHDHIWIPVQKAMYGTDSMTTLTKQQVSKIFEVIERELNEKHELEHVPFPNDEQKGKLLLDAMGMSKNMEYPEYNGEPTI